MRLSNPCEHFYTLRQIKQLAADTGWEFVAVAEQAGLPVTPEAHCRNRRERQLLHALAPEAMFDHFAFHYRAEGFTFPLRPN